MLKALYFAVFLKRRRIVRGTIHVCVYVCMYYVCMHVYIHMYVSSHTVTPPLNYLSTFAHLLPPAFEVERILFSCVNLSLLELSFWNTA